MRSSSPNGPWCVPRARPFAHAANARHRAARGDRRRVGLRLAGRAAPRRLAAGSRPAGPSGRRGPMRRASSWCRRQESGPQAVEDPALLAALWSGMPSPRLTRSRPGGELPSHRPHRRRGDERACGQGRGRVRRVAGCPALKLPTVERQRTARRPAPMAWVAPAGTSLTGLGCGDEQGQMVRSGPGQDLGVEAEGRRCECREAPQRIGAGVAVRAGQVSDPGPERRLRLLNPGEQDRPGVPRARCRRMAAVATGAATAGRPGSGAWSAARSRSRRRAGRGRTRRPGRTPTNSRSGRPGRAGSRVPPPRFVDLGEGHDVRCGLADQSALRFASSAAPRRSGRVSASCV